MTVKSAALFAAMALIAAPAQATTVIDFGDTKGQSGANQSDGKDGNVRSYTAEADGTQVNVKAQGWTVINGNIQQAFLGAYSGGGLGVTSSLEGSGSGYRHTLGNGTSIDFITFQFDQLVTLDKMFLAAYGDTDAALFFDTTGLSQLAWNGASMTDILKGMSGGLLSNGTNGSAWRSVGAGDSAGDLWIISAGNFTDSYVDQFKVKGLSFNIAQQAAVPEPATWLMLLLGFFGIGGVLRRRQEADPAVNAAFAG